MRKGERTKKTILDQAAEVFSVRGYAGASMDDLTRATQLTKGGLYNHFGSKDELALAAFDHVIERVYARFRGMAAGLRDTRARLNALMDLYISLVEDPVVQGGCPVLYTAVEADDTHPALRERAKNAADEWRGYIVRTLTRGMELGSVKPDVDAALLADGILASLEGGIVLSKLYGHSKPIRNTVAQLKMTIEALLTTPETT